MKIKKRIADYLINRLIDPEHSFRVEKEDVFLISYPKSGNTWMRFLLANILTDKKVNLVNLGKFIPDIYRDKRDDMDIEIEPKIFKTHSHFRAKYSKNKIIYLLRDPKDVAVSYYFYYKKTRKVEISFDDYLKKFLNSEIDTFGNWAENVGSWLGAKEGDNNFLVVRYEDMLVDLKKQLFRVLDFLDLEITDKKIEESIEKSDFKKLQADEIKNNSKIEEFKKTNKSVPFFRSGTKGNWKEYFNESNLDLLYKKFGVIAKKYGYDR